MMAIRASGHGRKPRLGAAGGHGRGGFRPLAERLDDRMLLSTFTVSNLNDAGAGSLRDALISANTTPGADVINFTVSGSIALTSGALPAITDPVNIDGTTAPTFAKSPVVRVDFLGNSGLQFNAGSAGSALRSLDLAGAGSDAVTLNDKTIQVLGNYIGVGLDGKTPAGNQGNGLVINASSTANTIGATSTVATTGPISLASNVISGNKGNGIVLNGTSGNLLVANYVGTDASGTTAVPNGGVGLLFQAGATANTVGGVTPFGSSTGVPQSNLISGNAGNGITLTDASSNNFFAGNLVGTDLSGSIALGNAGDGMAILKGSNGNTLSGTTQTQQPFVYANVFDGNGGDGLRIRDSDNTLVQANLFGLGLGNKAPVGNHLDGLVVEGASKGSTIGGVIPLGNVISANFGNGMVWRDTSSGSVSFNTFAGTGAFSTATNLGNALDGMLITTTGGNNLIRTNVVSGNHGNGIEIGGSATGVQVTDNIVGLTTNGQAPLPNYGDGLLITGNATKNTIGGQLNDFSIIRRNIISGNLGHGIAVAGSAANNLIIDNFVGTDYRGVGAIGNAGAGISITSGTSATTIGGTASANLNVISGNAGNGIQLLGTTTGNVILGTYIGTDVNGTNAVLNGGSGVFIDGSSNNLIGGPLAGAGNLIAFNGAGGVFVNSGTGNAILGSSIFANGNNGIVLQPGANHNQAAPKLTRLIRTRSHSTLQGTLQGAANTTYHIEFFANARSSTSAGGETFLGSADTTTDSRGRAQLSFVFPTRARSNYFTATATSPTRDTSVFSNAFPKQKTPTVKVASIARLHHHRHH